MNILGFDTCLGRLSVALLRDGEIIFHKEEPTLSRQAEVIMEFLEEALATGRLGYEDLSAIAVTNGPGSFTGVRIGLSVAKGISLVTGVPIFAASTLQVMASKSTNLKKITMIQDAGRGMVYSQSFLLEEGYPAPVAEPILISRNDMDAGSIEVSKVEAESLVRLAALRIDLACPEEKILPLYIRAPDAKLPAKKCV